MTLKAKLAMSTLIAASARDKGIINEMPPVGHHSDRASEKNLVVRPVPKMSNLAAVLTAVLAGSSLLGVALAHPGETHSAEKIKKSIAARDLGILHSKRVVEECAGSATHQALRARAAARRAMTAQVIREKRDIVHSKRSCRPRHFKKTH